MPLSGKSNHSWFPKDFEEEGGRPVLGKHLVNVGNRKQGKTRKIWANAWKTNVFARTENLVWELFFFSCLNPSMFFFFYKTTHHMISNKTNECTHEQLHIWTTNTFTAHLTWNRVSKWTLWNAWRRLSWWKPSPNTPTELAEMLDSNIKLWPQLTPTRTLLWPPSVASVLLILSSGDDPPPQNLWLDNDSDVCACVLKRKVCLNTDHSTQLAHSDTHLQNKPKSWIAPCLVCSPWQRCKLWWRRCAFIWWRNLQ